MFHWDPDAEVYVVIGEPGTADAGVTPVPTQFELNPWEGYWIGELSQSQAATSNATIVLPDNGLIDSE